ncbi:MAG TPA: succinate dehydrogenase, cytochrome b556 subunit [Steroidobacteraceae bacterium]|nr:succinate dehydrogenase, cytochrome b556 subunit [Steroidobacteraceae bacterium]
MPARARPLSPHLQIYRWQMGNTLSIVHRMTGAALSIALVGFVAWLAALAAGPECYARAMRLLGGPAGALALSGFGFAFFYHLLNGIRHLAWDVGYGYGRRARHASGWLVVVGALALTAVAGLLVAHIGAGAHG